MDRQRTRRQKTTQHIRQLKLPLERHHNMGQRQTRPHTRKLPTPIRNVLLRLVRNQKQLQRKKNRNRTLDNQTPIQIQTPPHNEAHRTFPQSHTQQHISQPNRTRPLHRKRNHHHSLRTNTTPRKMHRTRPTLRRCMCTSLGAFHGPKSQTCQEHPRKWITADHQQAKATLVARRTEIKELISEIGTQH